MLVCIASYIILKFVKILYLFIIFIVYRNCPRIVCFKFHSNNICPFLKSDNKIVNICFPISY